MEDRLLLAPTRCGDFEFRWGERTYIMGVLNLSPDSFSGDGVSGVEAALARAREMAGEGADVIDVGGESTRPGAAPISVEEELRRVIPVIRQLAKELSIPISIDSYKAEVVSAALEAGARIINDQWGLKYDPRLGELASRRGVPLILMSNQRDKGGYDPVLRRDTAHYKDVLLEVTSSLKASLELALSLGVPRENIILDPGIGFGKTWQQDIEIIGRLNELRGLGRPILVGPSRKSFIGKVLDLPVNERLEGTAAAVAIAISQGADMVRVHDVRQMVRICRLSDAIVRRRYEG